MINSDSLLNKYDNTQDSRDIWKYELVKAFYLPEIDSKCSIPEKSKDCVMARFDITKHKNLNSSPDRIDTIHYVLLVADKNGKYQKVKEMEEAVY